jgi:potassium-dependent mechanosensitive channel
MCGMTPALVMVLALSFILSVPAPAAQERAGVGAVAAEPTPAIPIAEVATRAEEVAASLRALDTELSKSPQIAEIEEELPALTERLTERSSHTAQVVNGRTDLMTLDALAESWQSARLGLAAWMKLLTRRATWLEQELDKLATLRGVWTETRGKARQAAAPGPVIERIDGVLSSLATARGKVESQRAATLVLQDKVARELGRSEQALALIGEARQQVTGDLLTLDSPPIWSENAWFRQRSERLARYRESVAAEVTLLQRFVHEQSGRIIFQVALILGLAAFLAWVRSNARRRAAPDEVIPSLGKVVFARPLAAAVVLGLLSSAWIYSDVPRAARTLLEIGMLVPVVMLLRRLVPSALAVSLYTLGAFFVADRLRDLATGLPLLERVLFLLEMLAATLWLALSPRVRSLLTSTEGSRLHRLVRVATHVALAGFFLAFVAGTIGSMSLARLLGAGILTSAYAALVVYAGLELFDGLLAFALRMPPLRDLHAVRLYRSSLEARGMRLLSGAAIVVWVLASLNAFGLLTPTLASAQRILTAELTRGSLRISLGDVLAFAATIYAAFLISSAVRFVLQEDVFPRMRLASGLPYTLSNLLGYAIVAVGFIVALLVLGVNLDRFTLLGGAFGVGIGFGLQNVVNNFVSGLIVLFERPVRVGDNVQIGDVRGDVQRIGIRSSTVRTGEGAEVIVPNSMLVAEKVTNWTPFAQARRIDIKVNVAYGTAPDRVLKILAEVAGSQPDVSPEPAPLSLFLGFGASALGFELWVWTARLDRAHIIKSDLGLAVHAALTEAGISLAVPQQEIVVRRPPGPPR